MAAPTLLITDERMLEHENPSGHPERPRRLAVGRDNADFVHACHQRHLPTVG